MTSGMSGDSAPTDAPWASGISSAGGAGDAAGIGGSGAGRTAARLLTLCLGGVVLGLLGNAVHPHRLPLSQPVYALADSGQCSVGPQAVAAAPGAPSAPDTMALDITEAARLRGEAQVVFGDLRPPAAFAGGHIIGARHLPCRSSLGQEALARLPAGTRLVLYDNDGSSPELAEAAATARQRGLSVVYLLRGGFVAWMGAGLPAESGTCDTCAP